MHESHKVDDVFRFSAEVLAKFRILCCHTNRTCIQITHPHHNASHSYKWCCRKSKFLCSKDCCNCHVTTTHQFSICLNTDTFTQSILDQCLMCFRKSKLPRKSCIVDRTLSRRSGSSIISRDQDQSGSCFCDSGCDSSNTCFRYKFYGNPCVFICIFTVINELCQILDRVNIVMRWW